MGIFDDLKHKAEELGDKAKEGLDAAKDKAGDLLDDAKDRFGHDDTPLTESSDVGPDTASTDAVQPGYVAAEDDVTGEATDESSLTDDAADDASDYAVDDATDGVVEEEAFAAEPVDAVAEPLVATDVDPYDEPLTETIGDEIRATSVDSDALAEAVDDTSDRDA